VTTYSLRKKGSFVSIIIILAMLIAFLLGEAYIRLTREYITPGIIRARSLQYSPSLFARHVFPLNEQILDERGWSINAKGYRGKDFHRKKDDGTIRVIVYGGSAVFDQNLPNGKDWPYRFEHLLKEKGITNIEVINAGIPGHASFDSFGRLFAEGHIFEPDYVILYNAWNDIKYFSMEDPLLRKFKPYNESHDFRSRYQGVLDQMACELSQLYVRLRGRYYNWKYHIGNEGAIQSGEYIKEVNELGLKQYRLNVEMFVDLARNIHAVPILVTQARLVAHKNTDEEKSRIGYHYQKMNHQTLVKAFEKTDDIIRTVAKSKHTPIIDASKRMSGKDEFFTDHVHLSNKGSNQLAMIMSEYLFSLIKEQNISSL
jgi:lysophospholipase L1-like esterase